MPAIAHRLNIISGLQAGKGLTQFLVQQVMCQLSSVALGDHRQVNATIQLPMMMSIEFSNPALETITTNSIANLAAHGQSKTVHRAFSWTDNNDKMSGMITMTVAPDPGVFIACAETTIFLEGLVFHQPL